MIDQVYPIQGKNKIINSMKTKTLFLLGGRFQTPVLDNTIKLPYLRTTPGTQKQKGQTRYPI